LTPSPSGFGQDPSGRPPVYLAPAGGNPGEGGTPERGKTEILAIVGYFLVSFSLFTAIPALISQAPGFGLLVGVIVCPLMIYAGRLLFRVRLGRRVDPLDAPRTLGLSRTTADQIGVALVYFFLLISILLALATTAMVVFFIICTISSPHF
jgi:hypothetical protein